VRNDNTVTFKNLILQLPTTRERMHFVRCPVSVHQFPKANLGVSYQGRLLARYDATGGILSIPQNKERAASAHRLASIKTLAGAAHRTGWRDRSEPVASVFGLRGLEMDLVDVSGSQSMGVSGPKRRVENDNSLAERRS